jgi:hypothetical protein
MLSTYRDHPSTPIEHLVVDVVPRIPRQFVVLAIAVVVAPLGATELVAAEQHRDALREQQGGDEVAFLACPQREDLTVVGRSFDTVVPRSVVRLAVGAVLAVRLVVLVVTKLIDAVGRLVSAW